MKITEASKEQPEIGTDTMSNNWISKWVSEKAPFTWENLKEEHEDLSSLHREDLRAERFGYLEHVEETPGLIAKSLIAMEDAIESINHKEAYETAMFVIPEYVQDTDFRLAFLRSDRFDAKSAAKRMVKYWERKVQLFGTDIAFKPGGSTILDLLSRDDILAFEKGGLQILPNCDEHGRALFLVNPNNFSDNVDSMIRYHWVLLHMATFDPKDGKRTQTHGTVQLWAPFNSSNIRKIHPFDTGTDLERFFSNCARDASFIIPTRPVAFHIFVKPNLAWIHCTILEKLLICMGRLIRLRLDFYVDSHDLQNFERLEEQGILMVDLPAELGGLLEFDYNEWLRRQYDLLLKKQMTATTMKKNAPV